MIEALEHRLSEDEMADLLDIIALTLPLDQDAIQQVKEMEEKAALASIPSFYENDIQFDEAIGEDVYVGQAEGEEDEAIVEDVDELENEGRGEGAIDDEPKDDE